ncbi:MAG: DNA-directed RNA polymerase subunit L [Metallosphaera sp.]|uniref:DNA-directed RNA polymerase subunit Rpo11 n=1 Tax=Metallosphaera cuprina (strain Ar-4) TaxID=1006006 RepID=F4G030_METCR|nr:DNA-directed RNA polymerase subunit L [Metallosphaera cuprina]AEB94529.1 DNA-directed RNA polymerase, subunit L [Metallosphaera cuprina Ar-4]
MEVVVEKKDDNYVEFRIQGEDHTLGNLVAATMRRVPGVILSTYYLPHPLKDELIIKVKTDGSISPVDALKKAIEQIEKTAESFLQDLEKV